MNKILNIDYSFHTHTKRCGHAYGEDEEYVKEAIRNGFNFYGFSDHGMFIDLNKEDYGRDYNLIDDYISSVKYLKEKYKEEINIFLGFEFEYDKNHIDFYKDLLLNKGFDYFVLGQHFFISDNKANYYFSNIDDMNALIHYKNDLIEGMSTGLFKIVAHPDLFMNRFSYVDEKILGICREIIDAAIKYDVALELNLGGMRFGNLVAQVNKCLPYPNGYFWEEVAKTNAKVVIGIDSHSPNDLHDDRDFEFINRFINKYKLNVIKDFRIK